MFLGAVFVDNNASLRKGQLFHKIYGGFSPGEDNTTAFRLSGNTISCDLEKVPKIN